MKYILTDQYILGQIACLQGSPAKQNASESFIRGFAAQYEVEQRNDAQSEVVFEYTLEKEQRDYQSDIAPGLLLYPSKTECEPLQEDK